MFAAAPEDEASAFILGVPKRKGIDVVASLRSSKIDWYGRIRHGNAPPFLYGSPARSEHRALEAPQVVTSASCHSPFMSDWREDFHGNF